MKNCTICGKPIVLYPSAAERAKADVTGKTAQYYEDLFTAHDKCLLAKREQDTIELIRRNQHDTGTK